MVQFPPSFSFSKVLFPLTSLCSSDETKEAENSSVLGLASVQPSRRRTDLRKIGKGCAVLPQY